MADNWQLKAVLSAVDKMSPALKQIQMTAKTTRKYLMDIESAASHLGGKVGLPITLVSGALAALSVGALKNAVVGFAELGESLKNSSMRAGVSVEAFQKLKYVSDQVGIPVEALEGAFGKLNKNIGNAAAGGNKNLAGLFQKLGISARDASGHLRTADEILPQLADAFVKNKNPVTQARMGMALFGKSWQELLPLLALGSAGIAKSVAHLATLKSPLTDEQVEQAAESEKQLKDMDVATASFKNTIASALLPTLQPMILHLTEWLAVNRKLIAVQVKAFVKGIAEWIDKIDWKGVVEGAKSFFAQCGKVVEALGGMRNALIALVLFMNIQTIAATWDLIAAFGRMGLAMGGLALKELPLVIGGLTALNAELVAGTAFSGGLIGSLGKLVASMGAVAAAGAAGYGIGTLLYDHAISGTKFGDAIGSGIAHVGAFFGNEDAKASVASMDRYDASQKRDIVGGSKSHTKVEVAFANAPPGMQVQDISSKGPASVNVDVGRRSFSDMSGAGAY